MKPVMRAIVNFSHKSSVRRTHYVVRLECGHIASVKTDRYKANQVNQGQRTMRTACKACAVIEEQGRACWCSQPMSMSDGKHLMPYTHDAEVKRG